MEVFFKRHFKAGLAHHGIHFIALVLVIFPLVAAHGAHIAQNMGCILGGIFPNGGSFHVKARDVQLQNGGPGFFGYVLNEHKVGQAGDIALAQRQLIAQSDDPSCFLVGPFLGDLVAFAQGFDQQRGGNIRIQAAAGGQIGLEIALPGAVVIAQGIGEGPLHGDGKMIRIFDIQIRAQLGQPAQRFVGLVGV